MRDVNNITEDNNFRNKYSLKQAIYIIENIYRAHEEDGYNELIPSWYNALIESLKTLKSAKQTQTVIDYIEYCEYLLDNMPLLRLNELKI